MMAINFTVIIFLIFFVFKLNFVLYNIAVAKANDFMLFMQLNHLKSEII